MKKCIFRSFHFRQKTSNSARSTDSGVSSNAGSHSDGVAIASNSATPSRDVDDVGCRRRLVLSRYN